MTDLPEDEDERRERFVVLLRHGIAEERAAGKKDDERGLTSEGHARMKQSAKGLERIFPRAQAIISSPLLRAVQTSLWVSKGYRSRVKVQTSPALTPEAGPDAFVAMIQGLTEKRVIVVGHEPNLTENLMALISGGKGAGHFELKKGACYGVRMRADGTGVLEWLLSPRVLRKLSE